jgi:protein-tyrosine-phosphatase
LKKRFSILFVCTGNTCRSPLAEAITKAEIRRRAIKNLNVSSAGTGAVGGLRASDNAKKVARRLGLSLARFRARPLTRARVRRADLILTMNLLQKEEVTNRWPDVAGKVFVISEFSGSSRRQISDPVGGTESVYLRCARALSDEVRRMLPRIRRRLVQGGTGE